MKTPEILLKLKLAASLIDEVTIAMETPAPTWGSFVKVLAGSEAPEAIKPAMLAQAIIETGRGQSLLFKQYNNPAGIKYRDEMIGYATPVTVAVTSEVSGVDTFCRFSTQQTAIKGWLHFLTRAPYHGWEAHAGTAEAFLRFVCPIWAGDPKYLEKCLSVLGEAHDLLGITAPPPPEPETAPHAPTIDITKDSPNQSERGASIDHIVLHNTAGSFAGSVAWLCNPNAKASAHLVVSRDGKTAKLVAFDRKAWHAGNARMNANSIGIEIEATTSQRGMTSKQNSLVVEWIKWLMHHYGIHPSNVGIHRWYRSTDCPGLIWPTDVEFLAWRKQNLGG